MNKTQEALKLALEALEQYEKAGLSTLKTIDAIVSLREALAELPKEPPKFDPNESFAREEAAQAKVREFMRNH